MMAAMKLVEKAAFKHMIKHMIKQTAATLLLALAVLAAPMGALAQDEKRVEARVQNYEKTVEVPESTSALTWLLFILLAAICLSVLLMNPKRSHLD
jgi:Na+/H+ antiporter NhaC